MNPDSNSEFPANLPREGVPPSLPSNFNASSASNSNQQRGLDVSEVELKLLARDDDPELFERIKAYFSQRGWIGYSNENIHLITRQLDTPDLALYTSGSTARLRARCPGDDLGEAKKPDICVKTGKTLDDSGALRRGEYEVEIPSFEQAVFWTLREKYPAAEYPELHSILQSVRAANLCEYFRIDCIRHSYVIELPEEETGLTGRRFVAEVELDDIVFVLDVPGLPPRVFHYDREIECETRFAVSGHDRDCDPTLFSSPLTPEEIDRGMKIVHNHIIAAAGQGKLALNQDSKAERGFNALLQLLSSLGGHLGRVPAAPAPAATPSLPSAFYRTAQADSANDNANDNALPPLNGFTTERIAAITQGHAIAVRNPQP